jgi:hypothetical protein
MERVGPRAEKVITFRFHSRAQEASMEDFDVVLSVVEDEVVEATNGQGRSNWIACIGMAARARGRRRAKTKKRVTLDVRAPSVQSEFSYLSGI